MNNQEILKNRLIHLLYVPTTFCNLKCGYCYLDNKTKSRKQSKNAIETLQYAIKKFTVEGILPFHISLHGGEVTTLETAELKALFRLITDYYEEYRTVLTDNGFDKSEPHIKTNLYNFDQIMNILDEYKVSVSASIDLPLSMHQKFRLTKNGKPTLDKILRNLILLAKYPHKKKFSSVICYEHYLRIDELIRDIWKIHRDIGFDMNNFNFMFGFQTNSTREGLSLQTEELRTLTGTEQLNFYKRMKDEFIETELSDGFKNKWFEEFTPSYCTNSVNCGEKFFLLQCDGDVYSCVRGQSKEEFYFGNIYKDTVADIMKNAVLKIRMSHNHAGFDEKCQQCDYLGICKTGCPFVKGETTSPCSYTCELQKELYLADQQRYKPFSNQKDKKVFVELYKMENHPQLMFADEPDNNGKVILPNDLNEDKNSLEEIIKSDTQLKQIYEPGNVILELNTQKYELHSQIRKKNRQIIIIKPSDEVKIYVKKTLFEVNCKELVRNSLYLMLLRDTKVTYGDEQRTKQEHIFTHQVFYNLLEHVDFDGVDYVFIDITKLFNVHSRYFLDGVLNNFFIISSSARDYHYQKQKDNAFYHIQAINLPFSNIEFYWK